MSFAHLPASLLPASRDTGTAQRERGRRGGVLPHLRDIVSRRGNRGNERKRGNLDAEERSLSKVSVQGEIREIEEAAGEDAIPSAREITRS